MSELRAILLDGSIASDPRGVEVVGGVADGDIDLRHVTLQVPLTFNGCRLESIFLDGADLHELSVINCPQVGSIHANGLRTKRDFSLSHSRIARAESSWASNSVDSGVWLCEAEIGGRLLLVGTTIDVKQEAGARPR